MFGIQKDPKNEVISSGKSGQNIKHHVAGLMVNPSMINNGDHTNFICGNDSDTKQKVKSLLNEFGWKNENILDLGDIASARGAEAILPIWVRIMSAKQSATFNFKVVS